MPDLQPKVLQVVKRVIIDAAGTPVPGYHIDLLSAKGMRGYVEISADQYSVEAVKAAVAAEGKRLDDLLLI